MAKLCSEKIMIPYDQLMMVNEEGKSDTVKLFPKHRYMMVVYMDSSQCVPCTYKQWCMWNTLLPYEQEKHLLNFAFITESKDVSNLITKYRKSGLKHEILVDTCGAFRKQNPHIPESQLFHTFLFDERDSVVLVGDPTKNQKIEELLIKTIESPN